MENGKAKKLFFILAVLSVSVIWGMGFVAVEFALDGGIGEWALVGSRFLLAGGILWLFRAMRKKEKKRFCLREIVGGALAGMVNFIGFLLQTMSVSGSGATNSGRCALFTGTYVVLVPLMTAAANKKFRLRPFLNAVVFLAGMLILTGGSFEEMKRGDFLALACAVFFALQIMVVSRCDGTDFVNFNAVQLSVMGVCGVIGSLLTEKGGFAALSNVSVLLPILFLALFSSAYAYAVQSVAQRYLSEALVAILLSTESLTGVLFSLLFGRMSFSVRLAIGALVMSGACVFASVGDEKNKDRGEKTCE